MDEHTCEFQQVFSLLFFLVFLSFFPQWSIYSEKDGKVSVKVNEVESSITVSVEQMPDFAGWHRNSYLLLVVCSTASLLKNLNCD